QSIYFLQDIRPGDILEYSCSWTELDSISFSRRSPYCSSFLYPNKMEIERMFLRILATPEKPLQYHSVLPMPEPRVTNLSDTLQEWVWDERNVPPFPQEENQPSWYAAHKEWYISQYK